MQMEEEIKNRVSAALTGRPQAVPFDMSEENKEPSAVMIDTTMQTPVSAARMGTRKNPIQFGSVNHIKNLESDVSESESTYSRRF